MEPKQPRWPRRQLQRGRWQYSLRSLLLFMTAVAISCGIGGGARRSGREILDYALLGFLSFSVAAAIVMFIVGVMGYRAKMFQQESYRRWLQASQQIGLASFVGFLIAVGALTVYYLTEYVECLFL